MWSVPGVEPGLWLKQDLPRAKRESLDLFGSWGVGLGFSNGG